MNVEMTLCASWVIVILFVSKFEKLNFLMIKLHKFGKLSFNDRATKHYRLAIIKVQTLLLWSNENKDCMSLVIYVIFFCSGHPKKLGFDLYLCYFKKQSREG